MEAWVLCDDKYCRFGRKKISVIGSFLVTACGIAASLAPNVVIYLVLQCVMAFLICSYASSLPVLG